MDDSRLVGVTLEQPSLKIGFERGVEKLLNQIQRQRHKGLKLGLSVSLQHLFTP